MAELRYPQISLAEIRQKRDQALAMIANKVDPGNIKKAQKAAETEESETFEVIAREWYAKFSPSWAVSHSTKIIRRLELYVFPWMGNRPIKSILAQDLLTVLRRIEAKGTLETAHRTQQTCGQIFRYAVATGRAERDPSGDLRGALPPASAKHMATITEPKEIAGLLHSIDSYRGSIVTRCALQLRNDVGELWENYLVLERLKRQEYLRQTANNYFWRTYRQQELDLVEEHQGHLYGYEMKWGKAKVKPPTEWRAAYPEAAFTLVNKENYLEFIGAE